MVVPLVAAAGRTAARGVVSAAKKTRTGRRARAAVERPELLRRVRARERRRERTGNPMTATERRGQVKSVKRMLKRGRQLNRILPQNKTAERIRATAATLPFFGALIIVIPFQLGMWLLGFFATTFEVIPVVNWLPMEILFYISYAVISAVWVTFFIAAIPNFLIRGIDCFGGKKSLIFLVCLAASLTVYINVFPYIALWFLSVIWLRGEDEEASSEESAFALQH